MNFLQDDYIHTANVKACNEKDLIIIQNKKF